MTGAAVSTVFGLGLSVSVAWASPAVPIDWTAGTLNVLGVGTPRILSPTGSLLDRDAIELAREDAFARLRRLLSALPRPEPVPVGPNPLIAAGDRAAPLTVFSEPLFFADGTAHMVASVSLSAALGHPVPPPSVRVMRVQAPRAFEPCVQLRLEDGTGAKTLAGLPGDPIPHLRYRPGSGAGGPPPTPSPPPCTLRVAGPLAPAELLEVNLP